MSKELWRAWLDLCLILDGMEIDEEDRQLIDLHIEEILSLTYDFKEIKSERRT